VNSLDSLYALLRPLRLYALRRGSLIDAELEAYDAAFALIEQSIAELEKAAHPQLAGGAALDKHEQAVGLPNRGAAPEAARRELILRRLSGPFPPTRAGTEEALASCGLKNPHIEESALGLFISASDVAPGMTADECWQLALRALPAHLPAFIAGRSWDQLVAHARTWDVLDGLGRSWTELALVGIV